MIQQTEIGDYKASIEKLESTGMYYVKCVSPNSSVVGTICSNRLKAEIIYNEFIKKAETITGLKQSE